MGFNKAFINESKINNKFSKLGIEGLKIFLNSYDMYYIQDKFSNKIIESFNNGKLNKQKYLKIFNEKFGK